MIGQTDRRSTGANAVRLEKRGFSQIRRWAAGIAMLGLAGGAAGVYWWGDDDPERCAVAEDLEEPPAFPGAEGFGAGVTGGRGGSVIRVTTLDPDAPGGLREALAKHEARIVVFDVAGVIQGKTGGEIFEIKHGNITIAGQTAPGAGITLRGRLYAAPSIENIIVRHVRVRPEYDGSRGSDFDAIQFQDNNRVILDHVSAAFAVDENVDLYRTSNVTVQWSTIESAATVGHEEGPHNYGLIQGPSAKNLSVHHNLFVNQANRNPAIANGPADVINNVIYNARHGFVHHNPASGHFNIVGNYFKGGPTSPLFPLYFDDENESPANDLRYFIRDNSLEGPDVECEGLEDPWLECAYDLMRDAARRASRSDESERDADHVHISAHSSKQAYAVVLRCAGAFPRDAVTRRAVEDVENGTGEWGVREPADLMEGWPLKVAKPNDADGDGFPDEWEKKQDCVDYKRENHPNQKLPSGYSVIEQYINDLAEKLLKDNGCYK